jgi:hypothetical protein
VVSVKDPQGCISDFLERRFFFFTLASKLYGTCSRPIDLKGGIKMIAFGLLGTDKEFTRFNPYSVSITASPLGWRSCK